MAMSRKHYRAIAAAIRDVYNNVESEDEKLAIKQTVASIAGVLKEDNWHFDRTKFYNAAIGTDADEPRLPDTRAI